MQLKWIVPIAILVATLLSPSKLGGLKFVAIYDALTIRAQKTAPPYIAFEEIFGSDSFENNDWDRFEKIQSTPLIAGGGLSQSFWPTKITAQKIVLEEMTISKQPAIVYEDLSRDLNPQQRRILAAAHEKSEVLSEDWSLPTWSDEVDHAMAQSGYTYQNGSYQSSQPSRSSSKVYVAATNAQGETKSEVPASEVSKHTELSFLEATKQKQISGPLEITGGLAITNEHYIEIRRSSEGVAQEVGRVDLQSGMYSINVNEPIGSIEAKLVDKAGKILGEGSVRLSRVDLASIQIKGPKLKIEPHSNFSGIVSNFYRNKTDDQAPARAIATLVKGADEINVPRDGHISMSKIAKGSSTVLRAAAPKFMQSSSIVFSGNEFNLPMFPETMMTAMRDIVSTQQQVSLNSEGLQTVVWGRVLLDGKSVSGIKVQLESEPQAIAIYFNQFMLPDPKLSSTSENGLYAFLDVSEGMHSVLATRSDSLFGYQNVVVENGSVAVADLENTMRVESVPVRVFDAFGGTPQDAELTMQSMDQEINVSKGSVVLNLPQINRMGMIRVTPENSSYLSARYFYNDKDAFIHLPLVSWNWLSTIKSYLKIDDTADSGIIVGFVPDENFEVYLAAHDNFNPKNIVYFDVQGRILQTKNGIAGGGFIMYNVPSDIHETVVIGNRSQKVYSKVLPVDTNSLSVLTFRE